MMPCPISPNCGDFDTQVKLAFHLRDKHDPNDLVLEIMYLLDILNGRVKE